MSDSSDKKGKAPKRNENESGAPSDSGNGRLFNHPPWAPRSLARRCAAVDIRILEAGKKLPAKFASLLLEQNPALKNELAAMDKDQAAALLHNMDLSQMLTGLAVGGKNQKDMASYKFWQTQPVPAFEEAGKKEITQGPIKVIDPEKVSKTPDALIEGFEWCTLDLTNEEELKELYELLNKHYVEDDNAMFRFNYSESFLHWYD